MSGKTKPKCVRRVWERVNPITVALNASTLLTKPEREQIMAPLREARDALRKGACTERQWLFIAVATQVALCIENKGIVRGLREQITAAHQALCAIDERARTTGRWRAPTCYGHELVSVDTLVTLHAFQISQLAANEFRDAVALAKAHQRTFGKAVMA